MSWIMSCSDDEDPLIVRELKRIQTLSEEYELALRTNSYTEFQQKVHCYAGRLFNADPEKGSTTGLVSFRLFATSLLQPDEQAYNADQWEGGPQLVRESLQTYRETENFFSHEALRDFEGIHSRYVEMEEKLRFMQRALEKKLRRTKNWNKVANVVLTPVIGVVLISTLTVALVAFPVVKETQRFTKPVRSLRDWLDLHTFQREKKLGIQNAQLVAAAKGTFVVAEHLATIQRLVTRSSGEVEFLKDTMRFFEQRMDYDIGLEAVVDQVRTRQRRFSQHIQDLEEHVILFFLSLNRARSLVIQKISCL